MRDLHVHTSFSCDSEAQPEQYVRKALKCGIQAICFTDHLDSNPDDYGYRYYSPEKFFESFCEVQKNYGSQIELLAGVEFGEPHLYRDILQETARFPYDFIIGSIHWAGNLFPCQKVRELYSAKEFYTLYWNEVLSTVKNGGFDALGHIDFPKRYYGEIYYKEAVMKEIFGRLVEHDGVLEINTSSLRKGCTETMPGHELLEMYRASGGMYVTVGSDAHVAEDLGADYTSARLLLEQVGLQEVIYRERKRVLV